MAWTIELSKPAERQFERLDRSTQQRIANFLRHRLATLDDPRTLGQALKGPRLGAFWRFRVGDYRLICDVQDAALVVLIIEIGHRSGIYR